MAMNIQRKTSNIANIVSTDDAGNVILPAALAAGTIHNTQYTQFLKPQSGSYVTQTSSVTGAIAITLPVGMTNSMLRVTVKIYEYTTNESFEVHAGGYSYNSGNTWANNPFAYIIGNPGVDRRFNVRFGYNSTSAKAIIYIGELASTWAYPQVHVTEIQVGYSGMTSSWLNACTVGFETSAFQNVTATISNAQVGYAVSTNTANAVVLRDGSGNFSAGTITAALSGNASTATNLSTTRSNWSTNGTIAAVVGQLAWKHYGNGHTIFDASNGTSPDGTAVNNTNPTTNWTGTYPTLMGWNGSQTYGVRVDSARLADNSSALQGLTVSQLFNNMGDNHSTRSSFDATTASYGFGFRFVQGSTNGPGTGGSQYYSWYIGLGNDYPATGTGSYGAMFAVDRNSLTPYLSVRYNENNSLSTWRKIQAGYADNAGLLNGVSLSSVLHFPGWVSSPGYNANTMGMVSGFTYANNAPYTGPIVHFDNSGYGLQFNATYSGGTLLAFRTRNGDSATWNSWQAILNASNYTSYAPSLTGSGASGTWSINVTGTAASETFSTVTSRGASTASAVSFTAGTNSTSTTTGTVVVSGGVGISGNFYAGGNIVASGDVTAFSDVRIKENIVTIDQALEKVSQLRGVYFTRKNSADKSRKLGVIAQEVREILPEVVLEDGEGTLNVAYGNLVGVLIEAVKEQQQQISDLQRQIQFIAENK